ATVGAPPKTVTAPPLTRILPAASRLIVMVLSAASPNTDSNPPAAGVNRANTAGRSRPSSISRDGANRAGRAGFPDRRAPRSRASNRARSIYVSFASGRNWDRTGLASGLASGRDVRRDTRRIHNPAGDRTAVRRNTSPGSPTTTGFTG